MRWIRNCFERVLDDLCLNSIDIRTEDKYYSQRNDLAIVLEDRYSIFIRAKPFRNSLRIFAVCKQNSSKFKTQNHTQILIFNANINHFELYKLISSYKNYIFHPFSVVFRIGSPTKVSIRNTMEKIMVAPFADR